MTRVGAIDCGTNSIRLLIADIDSSSGGSGGSGVLVDLVRRMEIVRLGHGVDKTGVIAPDAMARTLAMAREYATQCVDLGVEKVRFVATSASRDARNAQEFVDGVHDAFAAFGVTPDVVTGHEEASLSFHGATGDLRARGIPGPYLMVDLGGGSTEFVRGTEEVEQARSVDVGCVRITERHLRSDPPTPGEIAAAAVDIESAIDQAAELVGFDGISTLVGLAGSITTITAHALRLTRYDAERIHLSQLPSAQVIEACTSLLSMARGERAALPFMHSGRVDVIGAGALVWRTIVQRLERDAGISQVVTSEHDILDGIALSIA
jgi:exopolyphosphatase/guanosine-5'-triphosphate,3'-diphosphate pyrophosphatase